MKNFLRILSLFLALSAVLTVAFSLSSCGLVDDITNTIKENVYQRGTMSEIVYSSAFLDLQFTKPDDWSFLTDAEIAGITGQTADILSDEEFSNALDVTRIEFYAQNADGSDGANMSIVRGSSGTDLSELAVASSEYVKNVYQGLGFSSVITDPTTRTVAGKELVCVTVEVDYGAGKMVQFLYMGKKNNFVYTITFTTASGISQSECEAMLSSVK